MIRPAQEFLHLIELVGQNDRVRILLPVDGARLERRVELTEAHRHRIRLERLERVEEHRVRYHAELQSFKVLGLRDRPLAVGHVAEPEVPIREADQAFFRQLLEQRRAKRPVEQRERLRVIGDREREIDHAVVLHDPDERRRGGRLHFLHAALQRRRLLLLRSELIRRKFLDLQLSPAFRGDELGEFLHSHAYRMIRIVEVTEPDDAFLDFLGRGRSGRHPEHDRESDEQGAHAHVCTHRQTPDKEP